MASKTISQKKFLKGVSPATGILSQAPATIQRTSNLLLTQRGALQTCDGSFQLGTVSDTFILILVMGVFNDYSAGSYPYYPVLASDNSGSPTVQLFIGYPGTPATVIVYTLATLAPTYPAPLLTPALLAPGDPQFAESPSSITNYNPSSTSGSAIATVVAPNPSNSATVDFSGWSSVAIPGGATVQVNLTVNANTHFLGSAPGLQNTELFYSIDSGATFHSFYSASSNYGNTNVTFNIPGGLANIDTLVIQAFASVRIGGATTATITFNVTNIFASVIVTSTLSPYGGVTGQICLIPQIVQFADETILMLGNGLAPQTVDVTLGSAAVPANLTNTFTASYPDWQASVAWAVGNQISVLISGTNYLFTATQGGISGSSAPSFSPVSGSTTVDNQVIWTNSGSISSSPAPRGAAHGIVYAGSLWLANTAPLTSSDQLDGPTVIKMSDTNNPQSWNPLNVAFMGRDDGTQITGLAPFTIAEAGIAPTGSLTVFKEFSTYQIFGVFGSTDFQISIAQTDMGCVGPRTIQFIPGFGICRLAHLGFAIFDGVRDRLISEEIRPYIFGGIIQMADITPIDFSYAYFAKGIQSTTPPMYFCIAPLMGANGAMTRVFCYDLVMKAWMIIDLPWPVSALTSVRVGEGKPVLLAGRSDTGIVERLQEGDSSWDAGVRVEPVDWSAQLNDVFVEGSSVRVFYRGLTIRGQSLDSTAPATVVVNVTFDGNPSIQQTYFIEPQPGSNQFQLDVDLLQNAQIAHVNVSGSGRVLIDSIDWMAQPKGGRKVVG